MSAIVVKTFAGLRPISDPVLLDNSDAQIAKNVLLNSGAMRPMKSLTTLKALKKVAPKTIYRFDPDNNQPEDAHWLEWAKDTDVMRSPIAQDQFDRLYWTDAPNGARYAPASMVLTAAGDGSYPGASWLLGVPKPSTKPTVDSFTAPEAIETGARVYCLTFWDGTNESAPGPTWNVQGVDGKDVVLTNLTTDNRGNPLITEKRLYRKVPDPAGQTSTKEFHRIASIPIDDTEYTDSTTDAAAVLLPTLPLRYSPTGPKYPPIVSADVVTTGPPVGIVRTYCYTVCNGVHNGVPYTQSAPSPEVSITADDSQTVTMSNLVNPGNEGQRFRLYRRDAGNPTMLLWAELTTNNTAQVDRIWQTTPVMVMPLGATDGGNVTAPPAPTLAVDTSTAQGSVKRIYMVTYLNANNNESPKSPDSQVVEVIDGKTEVSIYHNEPLPAGVTKKRLYRQDIAVTDGIIDTDDANWKFVAENTAAATDAVDTKPTSALPGGGYPTYLQNLPESPLGTPSSKADIPPSIVPETRVYCYTYVTAYDEEGPPSPSSDEASVDPMKPVTITCPGGPPTGAYNITKKRIYRSATGTQATKFQFVGEMPVAQTSFVDDVRTSALSELLETEGWIPPPVGLQGLRLMANGAAVGFVGNSLYFSEPNLPHAWPHEYPIDAQIVAIGTFGQSVAVLTTDYPYLFTGVDPAAMASSKMQLPQAITNKRSMVETSDGVLYASPDGLTMIGQGASLVTQPILSREQWSSYNPTSMECYIYNGRVLVTYDNGTRGILVIDTSGTSAAFCTSDVNGAIAFSGGYYGADFDIQYFAQGTNIVRFDQGAPITAVWKSKKYRLPQEDNFGFAKVLCKSYAGSPEIAFFADGVQKHLQVLTGPDQFRLPAGFKNLDWEFQVTGAVEFTEVAITSSSSELQQT